MSDKMQLVVATLELKVHLRDGDALITRAWAKLVARFLDDRKVGDIASQFAAAPADAA
jgi:hypothetical protein